MKKKYIYRILPIALSLSISSSLLIGCGGNVEEDIQQTNGAIVEESDVDVWAEEEAQREVEEARKAEEEARKIEEEAKKAEEEAQKAEEEAKKAEEAAKAEEERLKAEAEAKKAEEERLKAEAEAQKAEEERLKAEEERLKAEAEVQKAEEERLKAEAEVQKAEEERLKAEAEENKAKEERLMAEAAEENELTPTQLTSINMLNYMTVLTQEINNSNGNQLFLESARTSLYNDTNLNAVDPKTQAQITQLVGTIDDYRMVDVKRDRLEFIYEQNRAQALRQTIPNPMGLLSAVQSGSVLKAAASVIYMAVDSTTSYKTASNQAEQQFIKEGWELDDAEIKVLQNSTTKQFDYMCNMVRDYDLPDEYVVRDADVKEFVATANKTNLVQKIQWLENNENKYQKFGPYWLELVKDYYDDKAYDKCLSSIAEYEKITARITRKDSDYATALPMVIISAEQTLGKKEYTEVARKYCQAIMDNTKDEDWALRYFVAQTYIDLYGQTNNNDDLQKAYDIANYNVNTLVDEQRNLNATYLNPIVEVKAESGASKRKKAEIKQYNKLIKDERKTALPPVSEALYLNCDLLFAISEEKGITSAEQDRIELLLHENGEDLFLIKALDNKFRKNSSVINSSDIETAFDGKELIIPASCISDRAIITVEITGSSSTILDDWEIKEVERPKKSEFSDYKVKLTSKKGKDYKYIAGDKITINVTPISDSPDDVIKFTYNVVEKKIAFVKTVSFERK